MRDTDADWRAIGADYPYWGVITDDRYKHPVLSAELLGGFYATGRVHMAQVAEKLRELGPFTPGSAIDFGCGVGRLTEAMTAYAPKVVGVDVSPGMLAQARANGAGAADYADALPAGPVDWINSFVVFQHIPPERGMALLDDLLARLAPGGFVSLHFTEGRNDPKPPAGTVRGPRTPIGWLFRRLHRPPEPPIGQMMMFDYDMGAVEAALSRRGVGQIRTEPTDHDGHMGRMFFGTRTV